MAADLHIHVWVDDLPEEVLNAFFANHFGHPRGPKSVRDLLTVHDHSLQSAAFVAVYGKDVYQMISDTPNIWIGEVSWLKAVLFEDAETFIPSAVQTISELLRNDPVLDDELESAILGAFDQPNKTGYRLVDEDLEHIKELQAFLKEHKGKRLFTVSW